MRHERIVPDSGEHHAGLTNPSARMQEIVPSTQWLTEELDRKNNLLQSQMALVEHYRNVHDQAMAAAGIGVWECNLDDNSLVWTKGVYDLFGLMPETRVERALTLDLYTDSSRQEMERLRTEALETGKSFSLDASILTMAGEERWMRLTAHVETRDGRPKRLFGIKQDITEQKRLLTRMQHLATTDALTRLGNRTLFQFVFHDQPDWEARQEPVAALVLIDLDGFKYVNDRFGHLAGDACLVEIARRMSRAFDDALLVARIGGDEFAVLLAAPASANTLNARLDTFMRHACAPVVWQELTLPISLSAGMAIPGNPAYFDANALFQQADAALYQAKQGGQGLFRIATPNMPPLSRSTYSECLSRTCEI